MKAKLIAAVAAAACVAGGTAVPAGAKPYVGSMTVTYSIGIDHGSGEDIFYRARWRDGATTWGIVDAPWSMTTTMDSMPFIYAYSMRYGDNVPTCTLTINGKVFMRDDGSDGSVQCYKSY